MYEFLLWISSWESKEWKSRYWSGIKYFLLSSFIIFIHSSSLYNKGECFKITESTFKSIPISQNINNVSLLSPNPKSNCPLSPLPHSLLNPIYPHHPNPPKASNSPKISPKILINSTLLTIGINLSPNNIKPKYKISICWISRFLPFTWGKNLAIVSWIKIQSAPLRPFTILEQERTQKVREKVWVHREEGDCFFQKEKYELMYIFQFYLVEAQKSFIILI